MSHKRDFARDEDKKMQSRTATAPLICSQEHCRVLKHVRRKGGIDPAGDWVLTESANRG